MWSIFNKWAAILIHPQIMSVSFPCLCHTSSLRPDPPWSWPPEHGYLRNSGVPETDLAVPNASEKRDIQALLIQARTRGRKTCKCRKIDPKPQDQSALFILG